ncbi:MAG: NAD(P)H-dependent oxidoreductase [Clostridia bacterium]|nr:NAD(P)H-dependent oxidoreductase [Clostridia bacterium]
MILYINACVKEDSRTDKIARKLLEKIGTPFEELFLPNEDMKPLNNESLRKRTELIEKGDYSNPMFDYAKSFAKADIIVISAPFWDLSFPAILKTYFENIYVTGIVSQYGADGRPHGLCKAKKLYYVTTAGGYYTPDYSYHYINELATVHFGIKETELIKAEMLDIEGVNADEIIQSTIESITNDKGE